MPVVKAVGFEANVVPIADKFLNQCWGESGYEDAKLPYWKAAQDSSRASWVAEPFSIDTLAPEDTSVTFPPWCTEWDKNIWLDGTYCVAVGYKLIG